LDKIKILHPQKHLISYGYAYRRSIVLNNWICELHSWKWIL